MDRVGQLRFRFRFGFATALLSTALTIGDRSNFNGHGFFAFFAFEVVVVVDSRCGRVVMRVFDLVVIRGLRVVALAGVGLRDVGISLVLPRLAPLKVRELCVSCA